MLYLRIYQFDMSLFGSTADAPYKKKTPQNRDILDANQLGVECRGLRITRKGKTLIIPQRSNGSNDPSNWNPLKRCVSPPAFTFFCFMPDFGLSIGIVALISQSSYVAPWKGFEELLLRHPNWKWSVDPNSVQHNLVRALFCHGAEGLFTMFLSAYSGR